MSEKWRDIAKMYWRMAHLEPFGDHNQQEAFEGSLEETLQGVEAATIERICERAEKHGESLEKSSPTTALAFVLFAAKLREMKP